MIKPIIRMSILVGMLLLVAPAGAKSVTFSNQPALLANSTISRSHLGFPTISMVTVCQNCCGSHRVPASCRSGTCP